MIPIRRTPPISIPPPRPVVLAAVLVLVEAGGLLALAVATLVSGLTEDIAIGRTLAQFAYYVVLSALLVCLPPRCSVAGGGGGRRAWWCSRPRPDRGLDGGHRSRLSATTDPSGAVATDATFFIPPSPSLPDGSFSNEFLLKAMQPSPRR